MYSVSQQYHNLIASGAEQNLLIVFNDLYLSSRDQDFESSGATLSEYFNTSTDVEMGEVASSTFQCSIMNYEGALSNFTFGEGRPYIGVKTGTGTYTKPSGATAYTVWTDSNNVNHTIVGYSNRATIDGTNISTDNKAVTILWAKDDVVYIQTTDAMFEYQYDVTTSAWTVSSGAVNPFMASKESEGVKWQNNLLTLYLDDGTTEEWEYCPLGVFNFEAPSKRQVPIIEVSAYDRMALFDTDATDFINREWQFPITLEYLFTELCGFVGVPFSSEQFTNYDMSFTAIPAFGTTATCRDILSYIAEASGNVARFDRDGVLSLRWYGTLSAQTLTENDIALNGYDKAEYITPIVDQITSKLANGEIYTEGSGENVYTVLANSFLASDSSRYAVILDKLQSIGAYTPIVASVIEADPSIEAGDRVTIFEEDVPLMSQTITWRAFATAEYCATGLPHRELPSSLERNGYAVAYNAQTGKDNSLALSDLQYALYADGTGLTQIVGKHTEDIATAQEDIGNFDSALIALRTDTNNAINDITQHIKYGIIGYDSNNLPIMGIAVGKEVEYVDPDAVDKTVKVTNIGAFTATDITFYVNGENVAQFGASGMSLGNQWAWFIETDGSISHKYIGD